MNKNQNQTNEELRVQLQTLAGKYPDKEFGKITELYYQIIAKITAGKFRKHTAVMNNENWLEDKFKETGLYCDFCIDLDDKDNLTLNNEITQFKYCPYCGKKLKELKEME